MKYVLDLAYKTSGTLIAHQDPILLLGSCFTANVGQFLADYKFDVLANPSGILFDPISVSNHILAYLNQQSITENNLIKGCDLYHSWFHHSDFSHPEAAKVIEKIYQANNRTKQFLLKSKHLIITLGTAFSYQLKQEPFYSVANCHRQPQNIFDKKLLSVTAIVGSLQYAINQLRQFKPDIQIIFTVSPVRHARDGLMANNRSKGRLIDAVHTLCEDNQNIFYFPAYELIIDVLRDYRYFDIDLIHPNYAATQTVFDFFTSHWLNAQALDLLPQIKSIILAAQHKPRFPETPTHIQFKERMLSKITELRAKAPWIDWSNEMAVFGNRF